MESDNFEELMIENISAFLMTPIVRSYQEDFK